MRSPTKSIDQSLKVQVYKLMRVFSSSTLSYGQTSNSVATVQPCLITRDVRICNSSTVKLFHCPRIAPGRSAVELLPKSGSRIMKTHVIRCSARKKKCVQHRLPIKKLWSFGRGVKATVMTTAATLPWTDSDSRVPMGVYIKLVSWVVLPHMFGIIGRTYILHV